MIPLLLAGAADPSLLMKNARALLAAPCAEIACAAPANARFRVGGGDASTVTSKDRAISDDGSKCNVVGARRCPKRGRTILRAPLSY